MAIYNFTIGNYPTKMNPRPKILTGQRFKRLWVIGFAGIINHRAYWHCLCDCGNGKTISGHDLIHHNARSCGCWQAECRSKGNPKHGEAGRDKVTPEYRAYQKAKARCQNPNVPNYADYGGRGIQFQFDSFEEFLAEVGRKPSPKHSLNRIDNHGHYEKGNIEWATPHEQAHNTRKNVFLTLFGKTQCLAEWGREYNICAETIHHRLAKSWCIKCAITLRPYQKCLHINKLT